MKIIPKFLTGFHIKLIAIITMLTDHLAAIVLSNAVIASQNTAAKGAFLEFVYCHRYLFAEIINIMRIIGRLSFPLFCFLLVQGFIYTRSRPKYALRLACFALVSEPIYDLAFYAGPFTVGKSNVFFTLLIGFLVIWAIDYGKRRLFSDKSGILPPLVFALLSVAATLLGAYICQNIGSSYRAGGVIAIVIIYLFADYPFFAQLLSGTALHFAGSSQIQIYGVFSSALILLYNGKRGRSLKYLFYLFYPLHLLILWGVARWLTAI